MTLRCRWVSRTDDSSGAIRRALVYIMYIIGSIAHGHSARARSVSPEGAGCTRRAVRTATRSEAWLSDSACPVAVVGVGGLADWSRGRIGVSVVCADRTDCDVGMLRRSGRRCGVRAQPDGWHLEAPAAAGHKASIPGHWWSAPKSAEARRRRRTVTVTFIGGVAADGRVDGNSYHTLKYG